MTTWRKLQRYLYNTTLSIDLLGTDAPLRVDLPRAKLGGEVQAAYRDHLSFSKIPGIRF